MDANFKKLALKIVIVGALAALLMWFGTLFWNAMSPLFGALAPIIFVVLIVGLMFLSMWIHPGVENWGEIIPPVIIAVTMLGMLNMVGLPYPSLLFPKTVAAELKPLVIFGFAGAMAFLSDTIVEKMYRK